MLVVACYGLKGQEAGEPLGIGPGAVSQVRCLLKEANDDVVDRG